MAEKDDGDRFGGKRFRKQYSANRKVRRGGRKTTPGSVSRTAALRPGSASSLLSVAQDCLRNAPPERPVGKNAEGIEGFPRNGDKSRTDIACCINRFAMGFQLSGIRRDLPGEKISFKRTEAFLQETQQNAIG